MTVEIVSANKSFCYSPFAICGDTTACTKHSDTSLKIFGKSLFKTLPLLPIYNSNQEWGGLVCFVLCQRIQANLN